MQGHHVVTSSDQLFANRLHDIFKNKFQKQVIVCSTAKNSQNTDCKHENKFGSEPTLIPQTGFGPAFRTDGAHLSEKSTKFLLKRPAKFEADFLKASAVWPFLIQAC